MSSVFFCFRFCRYQDGQREIRERTNRRIEHAEIGNRLWEEEMGRRRERLAQDRRLETERREREKGLLSEFEELCGRTQAEKANRFREELDEQCVSIIMIYKRTYLSIFQA